MMIDLSRLQVQVWSIDRLLPYIRNARTHTDQQMAQVAASIREFGWTNPILVAALEANETDDQTKARLVPCLTIIDDDISATPGEVAVREQLKHLRYQLRIVFSTRAQEQKIEARRFALEALSNISNLIAHERFRRRPAKQPSIQVAAQF